MLVPWAENRTGKENHERECERESDTLSDFHLSNHTQNRARNEARKRIKGQFDTRRDRLGNEHEKS